MKLSSKLALSGFVVILLALAFFGFPIIKDRYSNPAQKTDSPSTPKESVLPSESPEAIFDEEPSDVVEEDEEAASEDTFVQVLDADCKNECKNFQDPEDITYCKQTCGLIAPKKDASNCDALADLEKDYCLKDQAISKTDQKICDQIEDSGIKKTCKNRLVEDIVDQQMLER